jgi:signal transduction histidine kinase/ActR/RegA family two-component response regulator
MTTSTRPSPTTSLQAEVEDRFGVLPNFFCLGGDAPEITANLWGFARFGYLDNPLPSLFKERLFVYLSRFCEVRYCIGRHVGFLVGLGRPAGDRSSLPETVEQVVRLIRRPLPRGSALDTHLALLEADAAPLPSPPESGSAVEEAVFACATHVFLQTPQAARCLEALREAFTATLFQHLMVFLAFVRTAHYWTKVHPELGFEDDVMQLFATHEALAECVLNDPEASACEMTEVILDELHSLRTERGRREEMERLLEEQRVDSDLKMKVLQTETDTQLRELLTIAELARAEAEKANRTKDEFLPMLSHELRSPMNAMLGWIRILKTAGAQDTDLVRRAVETLERNIRVQVQTVDDLLDMSRILSGKLQLEKGRVELAAVVAGCVQSLKPSAEGKQIALRLDVKGDDLDVLGDEARLQQVVANLLGNAIKFTDSGGFITVTVERKDASASLVIEDTGRGIAPDFLPHLFERFSQADTGSTRTHGGLGLGLSIVKNIVSLHGGRIEAESAGLGRGARFAVVFPLAEARQRVAFRISPSKPAVDDGTLGTLDVLLVEDDADSREALEIVFRRHGSRVRSVASVRQALEAYDTQPPDVVISDVGMPGENGYVLIRAIRDREEGRSRRTLAIAITGFAGRQDHETALRAGFDEHVAKPVELDDLLDRVRVLAASRTEIGNRTAS